MKKILFFTLLILMSFQSSKSNALEYNKCTTQKQSLECEIALLKARTLNSPFNDKPLLDNGQHFVDGSLFMIPDYDIARTDLDGDGFKEIIVKFYDRDDLTDGFFCKENNQCLHYIFQDRNFDKKDIRLSRYKVMGPIFAQGIGLSTDEVINNYRSLRVYNDLSTGAFNVFQYDKKADNYFNISAKE